MTSRPLLQQSCADSGCTGDVWICHVSLLGLPWCLGPHTGWAAIRRDADSLTEFLRSLRRVVAQSETTLLSAMVGRTIGCNSCVKESNSSRTRGASQAIQERSQAGTPPNGSRRDDRVGKSSAGRERMEPNGNGKTKNAAHTLRHRGEEGKHASGWPAAGLARVARTFGG